MALAHPDQLQDGSLAEFLRLRRSRLQPSEVGLPGGRRRRTPGLRREEVADLAGIGASWYTALEQGRDVHPSDQVLRNLGRALRLTHAETKHLFFLAGRPAPHDLAAPSEMANLPLSRILDALQPQPAFIANRQWDWLAWNPAADVLYGFDPADPHPRNALWHFFGRPPKARTTEWERSARSLAARFRALNATCVNDPWFKEFIQKLVDASEDFRRIWPLHDVEDPSEVAYRMPHATVGAIPVDLFVFDTPAMPEARVVVHLLDEDGLKRLGLRAS